MSAPITTRLLRLRRNSATTLHSFSTQTPNNPPTFPQPESEPGSKPESPLNSIKATLQNQSRTNPFNPNHQTHFQNQPRNNLYPQNHQTHFQNQSRFNFSQQNQSASLEKVKQNLSQFRSRTCVPPPSSKQGFNVSGFLKTPNTGTEPLDTYYISRFKDNLKSPDSNLNNGGFVGFRTGGSWGFDTGAKELGSKLRGLRPEKRMGEWFSIQELSDRLVRLRENEEKEKERRSIDGAVGKTVYDEMRSFISKLNNPGVDEKKTGKPVQSLASLGSLGGIPSYMSMPPKEELLEQYFHPDNMSSAEKMKLELKKVRDEFKMSESDCGSARVQVAQLTTKIKHLSSVLAKKDKHSRKGLQEMVQKRKKLLKYLRRTDWDSYSLVLSKLGLRDNPEIKTELVKKTEKKSKKEKKKSNKARKKANKLLNN